MRAGHAAELFVIGMNQIIVPVFFRRKCQQERMGKSLIQILGTIIQPPLKSFDLVICFGSDSKAEITFSMSCLVDVLLNLISTTCRNDSGCAGFWAVSINVFVNNNTSSSSIVFMTA